MNDDLDNVLTEYFKSEVCPSSDINKNLRIAIDKKEKEIYWKQICITIAFIFVFSVVSIAFINVFLGTIIAKFVLLINIFFITLGSILFTTVLKKEILI